MEKNNLKIIENKFDNTPYFVIFINMIKKWFGERNHKRSFYEKTFIK